MIMVMNNYIKKLIRVWRSMCSFRILFRILAVKMNSIWVKRESYKIQCSHKLYVLMANDSFLSENNMKTQLSMYFPEILYGLNNKSE